MNRSFSLVECRKSLDVVEVTSVASIFLVHFFTTFPISLNAHNSQLQEPIKPSNFTNKPKSKMKFSTITYFMIAFVVTFASKFGAAVDVAPDTMDFHERRELELQGLEDYHRAMEEFEASNADRELAPDMSCYLKWCVGKVRGTCYTVYPKCYPL